MGEHSPQEVIDLLDKNEDCLTERDYREINAIIQNMYGLNRTDDRDIQNENTLGALIKARNNEINMLDQKQFETIYKKTNPFSSSHSQGQWKHKKRPLN